MFFKENILYVTDCSVGDKIVLQYEVPVFKPTRKRKVFSIITGYTVVTGKLKQKKDESIESYVERLCRLNFEQSQRDRNLSSCEKYFWAKAEDNLHVVFKNDGKLFNKSSVYDLLNMRVNGYRATDGWDWFDFGSDSIISDFSRMRSSLNRNIFIDPVYFKVDFILEYNGFEIPLSVPLYSDIVSVLEHVVNKYGKDVR